MENMTDKEMNREVPNSVLTAFDNTEDVLKWITDEGLEELCQSKNLAEVSELTPLGIELSYTNRRNKSFKVIVRPDDTLQKDMYEKVMDKRRTELSLYG